MDLAWAHHTGGDSKLVFAKFTFAPQEHHVGCPLYYRSQMFLRLFVKRVFKGTKNARLHFGKQGFEKNC